MARKQKQFSPPKRPKQQPQQPERRLLIGRNPLREILRACPERLVEVLTVDRVSNEAATLLQALTEARVPIRRVSEVELDRLAGQAKHQSFVALLKPTEPLSLQGLLAQVDPLASALIVVVDGVQDPHNLGAIFRAAECFGAQALLWSNNRTVSVTPVVTKAAVGATELLPYCEVSNLAQAIRTLKEHSFWVTGCAGDTGAADLGSFSFPEKTALVLGSEGEGMRELTAKLCDFIVKIPMSGVIDSLNVSQAAAVFLAAFRQQRPHSKR